MTKWKKLLKDELILGSGLLGIGLIGNILGWCFNVKATILTIILMAMVLALFMALGIRLGKKVEDKGYLAGLKFGGMNILIMFLLGSIFFGFNFSLAKFLYYSLLIMGCVCGSIIGVNKK